MFCVCSLYVRAGTLARASASLHATACHVSNGCGAVSAVSSDETVADIIAAAFKACPDIRERVVSLVAHPNKELACAAREAAKAMEHLCWHDDANAVGMHKGTFVVSTLEDQGLVAGVRIEKVLGRTSCGVVHGGNMQEPTQQHAYAAEDHDRSHSVRARHKQRKSNHLGQTLRPSKEQHAGLHTLIDAPAAAAAAAAEGSVFPGYGRHAVQHLKSMEQPVIHQYQVAGKHHDEAVAAEVLLRLHSGDDLTPAVAAAVQERMVYSPAHLHDSLHLPDYCHAAHANGSLTAHCPQFSECIPTSCMYGLGIGLVGNSMDSVCHEQLRMQGLLRLQISRLHCVLRATVPFDVCFRVQQTMSEAVAAARGEAAALVALTQLQQALGDATAADQHGLASAVADVGGGLSGALYATDSSMPAAAAGCTEQSADTVHRVCSSTMLSLWCRAVQLLIGAFTSNLAAVNRVEQFSDPGDQVVAVQSDEVVAGDDHQQQQQTTAKAQASGTADDVADRSGSEESTCEQVLVCQLQPPDHDQMAQHVAEHGGPAQEHAALLGLPQDSPADSPHKLQRPDNHPGELQVACSTQQQQHLAHAEQQQSQVHQQGPLHNPAGVTELKCQLLALLFKLLSVASQLPNDSVATESSSASSMTPAAICEEQLVGLEEALLGASSAAVAATANKDTDAPIAPMPSAAVTRLQSLQASLQLAIQGARDLWLAGMQPCLTVD